MKNIVLIDTNIILDFLLHRSPFYEDANYIMTLCAKKQIEGHLTPSPFMKRGVDE